MLKSNLRRTFASASLAAVAAITLLAGGAWFAQSAWAQGLESLNAPTARSLTASATLDSLTEAERTWLREHPVIRVAQDPGWPPIEFTNERGESSGMAVDYLTLIEKRLGVKFERVPNLSWQEAYARLKSWDIDMTTSVAVTPERETFWAFTKPYMTIPIVIVTQPQVTYISGLRELAGKKVAVVDGYAVSDWIPRDFPDIQLLRVKTAQEGLEVLQRGEVFAYIENMLVVGYHLAQRQMTNLKLAGDTPYTNSQCMAVRKDWSILAGILDKALDSISENERTTIYHKWLPIRYEHGVNYALVWKVVALCALLLAVLIVWIRKLFREIRSRTIAEAALRNSEQRFRFLNELGNATRVMVDPREIMATVMHLLGVYLGVSHCIYANVEDDGEHFSVQHDYTPGGASMVGNYRLSHCGPVLSPLTAGRTLVIGDVDVDLSPGEEVGKLNERGIKALICCPMVKEGKLRALVAVNQSSVRPWTADEVSLVEEVAERCWAVIERTRAEAALLESEELFRTLVDKLPVAIYISTGIEQTSVYLNSKFLELFGYSREEVLTVADWWPLAYPDEKDRYRIAMKWQARVEQALITKTATQPMTVAVTCKDGSKKTIAWLFIPLGKSNYACGLDLTDITQAETQARAAQIETERLLALAEQSRRTLLSMVEDQQRTQEALRQSQDLLLAVTEGTPDAIFVKDIQGRYLMWNSGAARFVGKSSEEVLGKDDTALFAPDEARQLMAGDRRVMDSGTQQVFEEYVTTGDVPRIFHAIKGPVCDAQGNIVGLFGIARDITERKQAEETLRYHEQLLQEMGRVAKIGGWEFDAVSGMGTWTDEVARIHGLDPGKKTNVELGLSFYTPDSRLKIEHALKEAIESGKSYDLELELITAQGTRKWVQSIGHPRLENGTVVEVRGSFQDITARKQVEEELRHHKEHLEELVATRTAELESFSYSVSHDLRAPLRAIDGFSHILSSRYRAVLDEQGRHYLDNIETAAQRMSRLIDDLLAFSRLGRRGVRARPVPLGTLMAELRQERSQCLAAAGAVLTVAADLPTVLGEPTLLSQALGNLLDNALLYRRAGVAPQIAVDWEAIDGDVIIHVRDNGLGIDAKYREKIFEVFQRLHRDEEFPGTGIGLSIVKKVAELLGGCVWVDSIPGEGSVFSLRLRCAPDDVQSRLQREETL